MSPDQILSIQQALDSSERNNQHLMATNATLQQQLSALVAEVALLRKELQESHQVHDAALIAPPPPVPQPAPVVTPPSAVAAPVLPPVTAVAVEAASTSEPGVRNYASAARNGLTEAQLAVIKSMKPPPRPFKARQPATVGPKPDSAPVCVYFTGVQSGPLNVLKERLRALRIRTSMIYNISFVGKSICEFLVDASYKAKFIEMMSDFTFRHLPTFDPAVPQDPNVTPETRVMLKNAYTHRLTAMASTTNRGFVRQVFLDMMTAAGTEVPSDLPDLTKNATTVPPTDIPAEPASEDADVTMSPAAEDPASASDEGKTVMPPGCDPTLSSSSHE